ncbi:uncharacterized protein LOC141756016 [Sebastes fasciatus]|uniref:uncharacterized protein LOC141756016 n=1 Tax=Sebastes fasciatus TaxID=394691 RepID=UPI003D9EB7F6
MTERPAQDPPGSSAASVQMPDTLHVDLPHVDPQEVRLTINKLLMHMTAEHRAEMEDNLVSSEMIAVMVDCCMDIIQTSAEAIVDVVMPQVYRYLRIYGTFSPSILGLTEDRIQTYLGDSVERGLSNTLKVNVQDFVETKYFSQMLCSYISETVNTVLDLTTQTPTPESRLPVVFVSGVVSSLEAYANLLRLFAKILVGAVKARQRAQKTTEDEWSQTSEAKPLLFVLATKKDLTTMTEAYITRMVKHLKNVQKPHRCVNSSNRRDVCVRVGTNTQILTVKNRESERQRSAAPSHCGFDAIPAAVHDGDVIESRSESPPFGSVTVIDATEDRSAPSSGPSAMESIKNIAVELVQAFLEEVPEEEEVAHTGQKLKELIDRIFNVVMGGHDYQIPSVPAGMRLMDTVTYRRLRGRDVTDPGIVAHTLYLRTEEVVTRCAWQILLPDKLHLQLLQHPTVNSGVQSTTSDCGRVVGEGCYEANQGSNATYDVIHETQELTESQMQQSLAHTTLMTLVVGQMLNIIGVRDRAMIADLVMKVAEELQDVDPEKYKHFHAFFMGKHYKDISQAALNNLLWTYGSLQELHEAVRDQDPRFEASLLTVLRRQWETTLTPVPDRKTDKKTSVSFFDKLKKLCCKKKEV